MNLLLFSDCCALIDGRCSAGCLCVVSCVLLSVAACCDELRVVRCYLYVVVCCVPCVRVWRWLCVGCCVLSDVR